MPEQRHRHLPLASSADPASEPDEASANPRAQCLFGDGLRASRNRGEAVATPSANPPQRPASETLSGVDTAQATAVPPVS